ncbi:MAG: hypothetical protein ABI461_08965, partial [Polyangiaceae bacterium]
LRTRSVLDVRGAIAKRVPSGATFRAVGVTLIVGFFGTAKRLRLLRDASLWRTRMSILTLFAT